MHRPTFRLAILAGAALLSWSALAQQQMPAAGDHQGHAAPGHEMPARPMPGQPTAGQQMPGQPAPGKATSAPGAESPSPAPADERVALPLSAGERDFVLNEMRAFLASVQGVVSALADGKPAAAAAAARASGMGHRHHVPRSLMMKLPPEWRQLGMDTHGRFDTLALEAEGMGDSRQMLAQLAGILANCNGCHAAYRLVVQ